MADSGEGYTSKQGALAAITRFKSSISVAKIFDLTVSVFPHTR